MRKKQVFYDIAEKAFVASAPKTENRGKEHEKMSKLKKKLGKLIQRVIDGAMGNGLMQEETTASGEKYITPGIPELIRRSGAESCVLLKNDGVLPLKKEEEVAVFGRCQMDWFCVGYGSGGDVHANYCQCFGTNGSG